MATKKYNVTNNYGRSIQLTDGLGRVIRVGAKATVTMTLPLVNLPKVLGWTRNRMIDVVPYVAPPPVTA